MWRYKRVELRLSLPGLTLPAWISRLEFADWCHSHVAMYYLVGRKRQAVAEASGLREDAVYMLLRLMCFGALVWAARVENL